MYGLLLFLGLSVVVSASPGRSPNADLLEELLNKVNYTRRFSNDISEDALLDVPALVKKYGYPIEEHTVETSDGYILKMHRIPQGRDKNQAPQGPRPAVLVMHGLFSSSADFLVLGPGSALGYLLAEEGYDVWLPNARGNYYSRHHKTLDPDGKDLTFWRFSWEQIGLYDLPAFTDHILNVTGQPKIQYIGHSQGGTVFLVLNSLRPEYNDKFISFQGLAPASYFNNNQYWIFLFLSTVQDWLGPEAIDKGIVELIPKKMDVLKSIVESACENIYVKPMCITVFDMASGLSKEARNESMIPIFLGHAPAGASIWQLLHYGQTIQRKVFARYCYNETKNLEVYGTPSPPEFNVTSITVPAYLHYGLADTSVNWKDLQLLGERLGNTIGLYKVERESFQHIDFVWAQNIKEEVYDKLIVLMKEADKRT